MTVSPRSARPVQPAPAVISRTLLSLGLIALSAAAFRLTLAPLPPGTVPSVRTLTQTEPLAGASRAQLTLNSGWTDLDLTAADLPGLLLRGQVQWPGGVAVTRQAERAGDRLSVSYQLSDRRSVGMVSPVRLRWDADGLHAGAAESPPRGPWAVRLGRARPTELRASSGSGDQRLVLTDAALSGLTAVAGSGELSVRLPRQLSGDARLVTRSGTLSAEQTGPQAAATTHQLTATSGSGEVRLDLKQSGFRQVRVQSGSGDVRVALPGRPGVDAVLGSDSGDLRVTVPARLSSGRLYLNGGSGDMTVQVPAGAAVRVALGDQIGGERLPVSYLRRGEAALSPAALRGGPLLEIRVSSLGGELTLTESPNAPAAAPRVGVAQP